MVDRHRETSAFSSGTARSAEHLKHDPAAPNGALQEVCSWEWDLRTNRVHWSDELCSLMGINKSDVPQNLDEFTRMVHPEDQQVVTADIRAVSSGVPFEHKIRLLPRSGGTRVVYSHGIPICERSGKIVSVIGFCRWFSDANTQETRPLGTALLLAQAEQTANFGTWEFDLKTRFGKFSSHLAQMLGCDFGVRISEDEYRTKIHPDDRAGVLEITRSAEKERKPFQYVARYLLPGGGVRHHLVRGIPITDVTGAVTSIVGLTFDFSDQNHAEGELHRLSQRLLRARDDERRNVARELHESTGQTLAALKMSLGRLRQALPADHETLHNFLQSSLDLAEDAVREIRTLSYLMHPPMLDEAGLRSALTWYAKGFAERSGISVYLDVPEDFGRHGQELETTVFRIVQEALTNVHRYSGSRTVTIRLSRATDRISAEIKDEGCGLPLASPTSGWNTLPGVGIVGMRERVKQLKGRFDIESSPGKGTTVRVVLPIVERQTSPRQNRKETHHA